MSEGGLGHNDDAFDLWVFMFPQHLVRLAEHDRRQLAAQRVNARTGLAGVAGRALLGLAVHSDEQSEPPPARRSPWPTTCSSRC